MNRRAFFLSLASMWVALPAAARTSQQINVTVGSDDTFVGQFLPARGARRISAIVNSDVKATAYLDISVDVLNEESTVMGVSSVELLPKQTQILVLPAGLVDIQAVRLRVSNRDRFFGRVIATISVTP